jgi:hypothetical protein
LYTYSRNRNGELDIMAHYAFLDENNIVTEVITGVDENELIEGKTPEQWYSEFKGQRCKRTSYNTSGNQHSADGTSFRGNYAGIGDTYDEQFDAFIPPKPFDSWKIDYNTFDWVAPIPKPEEEEEGFVWRWSETNKEWIKLQLPNWAR